MSKLPKKLKPFLLDIDPQYAAMIYAGTKTMEFRKRRLPLDQPVALVEDGVCTGYMLLSWEFRGRADMVWAFAALLGVPFAGGDRAGITRKWLIDYAGDKLVGCYGIAVAGRFDNPRRVNPSAPCPEEVAHA